MVVKEKASTKEAVKKTVKKLVKTKKEVSHVDEQHYSDDVVWKIIAIRGVVVDVVYETIVPRVYDALKVIHQNAMVKLL